MTAMRLQRQRLRIGLPRSDAFVARALYLFLKCRLHLAIIAFRSSRCFCGMASSPIDFKGKLKPLPPVSLPSLLDTHDQDGATSQHSSGHAKNTPVENNGDHLSHAERVARYQHLKSILEPFKHSTDASAIISKKQPKVLRPEGRPAKPRKTSFHLEGTLQVTHDTSIRARLKRFLLKVKAFFSVSNEDSFFSFFGKGSSQEAEQSAFNFVMLICTIYALYVPDIYIASYASPKNDVVVQTITNFVLFLFFIEFAYYSFFKKDYWNSFFFWLDLISTASLIPDALDLYGVGLNPVSDEFSSGMCRCNLLRPACFRTHAVNFTSNY